MSGLRVRRAPVADWYVDGDDSAVMVGANVVVLSQLATAVLQILDGDGDGDGGAGDGAWTDATVLTAGLVDRFGEPAGLDVHAATAAVLADLAEQQVVETDQPPDQPPEPTAG